MALLRVVLVVILRVVGYGCCRYSLCAAGDLSLISGCSHLFSSPLVDFSGYSGTSLYSTQHIQSYIFKVLFSRTPGPVRPFAGQESGTLFNAEHGCSVL